MVAGKCVKLVVNIREKSVGYQTHGLLTVISMGNSQCPVGKSVEKYLATRFLQTEQFRVKSVEIDPFPLGFPRILPWEKPIFVGAVCWKI